MSTPGKFFLATDFLDLGSTAAGGSGLSFAAKLAKLHTTPAPIPEGFDRPMFGFPVPTCCGETPQENSWRSSWADFYAENRLRAILRAAIKKNGSDPELSDAVEKVASRVVPRLVGDDRLGASLMPVVCHGDLWSGNHSRGRIGNSTESEEVVFDASAVYGHSEYDLGIMKMFGGAGRNFWAEYEILVPKAEPESEWEDRVLLYELYVTFPIVLSMHLVLVTSFLKVYFPRADQLDRYHHLNHFAMFGGAYREGAMSIMRRLISKYGS